MDIVREYFEASRAYSVLGEGSTPADCQRLREVIRFHGVFRPSIEGKDTAEQLAYLKSSLALKWDGKCGVIPVVFTAGIASFVKPTLLHEFVGSPQYTVRLDGFGVNDGFDTTSGALRLTPLFFGVEVKT